VAATVALGDAVEANLSASFLLCELTQGFKAVLNMGERVRVRGRNRRYDE
jgi:hypothetical protein